MRPDVVNNRPCRLFVNSQTPSDSLPINPVFVVIIAGAFVVCHSGAPVLASVVVVLPQWYTLCPCLQYHSGNAGAASVSLLHVGTTGGISRRTCSADLPPSQRATGYRDLRCTNQNVGYFKTP